MRVKPTRRDVFRFLFHTSIRIETRDVPHYVAELKRCAKMQNLGAGERLHGEATLHNLHTDRYVAPALIAMYSKCGRVDSAKEVFDCMARKNVIAWNALIQGYVENGQSSLAVELFSRMDCQPSSVTYIAVLKACKNMSGEKSAGKRASLELGLSIHKELEKSGLDSDVLVATALMDVYCRCGDIDRANDIFTRLKGKSVVTYNVLMLGYVENGRSRKAVELFMSMERTPSSVSYIALLKSLKVLASETPFEKQACLDKGVAVHKELEIRGLDSDVSVATTLLDMYFRCGSIHRARDVFERLHNRSVITWNTTILGYVENGKHSTAIELFERMDCSPTSVTYMAALKACRGLASERVLDTETCLRKGSEIHKQVDNNNFKDNLLVANSLVSMYGKCHSMKHAREVFDAMKVKDVVTWTSLIVGYAENGDSLEAMNVFDSMDCEPDSFTYAAALKACAGLAGEKDCVKYLRKGAAIHRQAGRVQGAELDGVVSNALLDMYGKYGRLFRGRKVFDQMVSKNVIAWNTLILSYVDAGQPAEALRLFSRMSCQADPFTYVAALKACTSLASAGDGREIHGMICKLGLERDGVVATALLDFYSKCGNLCRSEELFNGMSCQDIVAWNALVTGYSASGDSFRVMKLAREMEEGGVEMNGVTLTCILAACSHAGLVDEGRRYLEGAYRSGVRASIDHYNCIVDLLGRANRVEEALEVVKRMPFAADSVTWTSLLGACRKWRNLDIGRVAFDALVTANARDSALFVLMSDILSENSH